jgi:hypothetical protein
MKFTRLLLLVPLAAFPQAHPWYQTDFPPEEFKARVENVFETIGTRAAAVLQGVPQTNGFVIPRQGNDFYCLCGIPPRIARLESAKARCCRAMIRR